MGPKGLARSLSGAVSGVVKAKRKQKIMNAIGDQWTFTNDIGKAEAIDLLITAQGLSRYFRGFTLPEIEKLCHVMNFFVVNNGVDVLIKGEQASFFAVILNGRVDLMLPPNADGSERSVPMYKGDTIGDITYFMGGQRTGTCRCKQNGTVLAILPFVKVAMFLETESPIMCKIVWMYPFVAFIRTHSGVTGVPLGVP